MIDAVRLREWTETEAALKCPEVGRLLDVAVKANRYCDLLGVDEDAAVSAYNEMVDALAAFDFGATA